MILVGGLIIGIDQWSKAAIRQHFIACNSGEYVPLIGQYFGLSYACNTGAAFSLFEHGHEALLFLFIAAALATIIWLYIRSANQTNLLLKLSFGLVLGGAIGNLIDRFRLGYVTDFLLFSIRPVFTWPVFNLADSAICLGIFLLILYFWRRTSSTQCPSTPLEAELVMNERTSTEQPASQP
jgi:signal peptidase II